MFVAVKTIWTIVFFGARLNFKLTFWYLVEVYRAVVFVAIAPSSHCAFDEFSVFSKLVTHRSNEFLNENVVSIACVLCAHCQRWVNGCETSLENFSCWSFIIIIVEARENFFEWICSVVVCATSAFRWRSAIDVILPRKHQKNWCRTMSSAEIRLLAMFSFSYFVLYRTQSWFRDWYQLMRQCETVH